MALPKNPKFDIKLHYKRTLEISIIIALFVLIAAFKYFPDYQIELIKPPPEPDFGLGENDIPKSVHLPPLPPKPPVPIEAPSDLEDLPDIEFEGTDLNEDGDFPPPPLPPPVSDEEDVSFDYFEVVEKLPVPIGGISEIQRKIVYPEIARRVIHQFAGSKTVILDPFMGSGGVLVESMLHGNHSIGVDLNPFAVLLSRVKTTPIDPKKLEKKFKEILNDVKIDLQNGETYDNIPDKFKELLFQEDSKIV